MILPLITLAWPEQPLWPNSRKHRQVVAAHRAAQRESAGWIAREAGLHRVAVPEGVVRVHLHFHPATRRSFDTDNAVAAMKGALDAVADVLRLDDRWFQPVPYRCEPIKGGAVMLVAEATGDSWKSIGAEALALVRAVSRQREGGIEA